MKNLYYFIMPSALYPDIRLYIDADKFLTFQVYFYYLIFFYKINKEVNKLIIVQYIVKICIQFIFIFKVTQLDKHL